MSSPLVLRLGDRGLTLPSMSKATWSTRAGSAPQSQKSLLQSSYAFPSPGCLSFTHLLTLSLEIFKATLLSSNHRTKLWVPKAASKSLPRLHASTPPHHHQHCP